MVRQCGQAGLPRAAGLSCLAFKNERRIRSLTGTMEEVQAAVERERNEDVYGLAPLLQRSRRSSWTGSAGKNERLLHREGDRQFERRSRHPGSKLSLST